MINHWTFIMWQHLFCVAVLSTPITSEWAVDTPAFQLLMSSLPLWLLTVVQDFSLCVYHSSQTLATWRDNVFLVCFSPTPFLLTQLIPVFFNPINLHPVSAFPLTKGVPTIVSTLISTSSPNFPCWHFLSVSPPQVILHFSALPSMTGSNIDLFPLISIFF